MVRSDGLGDAGHGGTVCSSCGDARNFAGGAGHERAFRRIRRVNRARFDHVDLRVRSLAEARPFYEALLPEMGFTRDAHLEGWLQYEAVDAGGRAVSFFGVTESPGHVANENRIAFQAAGLAEVDRLADVVRHAGGRRVEGPGYEAEDYYAVFFEDASGNRFEICHREMPGSLPE